MGEDLSGLTLSRLFYQEAVRPILDVNFPALEYAAALIGYGSEVLGFDTPMSRDHAWGPRLLLFLGEYEYATQLQEIDDRLRQDLPHTFHGYPTNFVENPDEPGVRMMQPTESGPVNHFVWLTTLPKFFEEYLGLNLYHDLKPVDWLIMPEQKLRAVTAGEVFFDNSRNLTAWRRELAYYPREVWLLLLAAQWTRIDQEAPFVGRAGEAGDELGSQVVAARLVREIMRLCFLLERQYAPYSKWFGTAFSRLQCAGRLGPLLQAVVYSRDWQTRQENLVAAYAIVAEMYNALGLTEPIEPVASQFHSRPYLVLQLRETIAQLRAAITDPDLKKLLADGRGVIGSLDQWADSTDILSNARLCARLKEFYTKTVSAGSS